MKKESRMLGKWFCLLVLVVVLGWLGGSAVQASPSEGWLKVRVVDQQNNCLPTAEVSATNGGRIYNSKVGSDCVAQFHLQVGSCRLDVSCKGYKTKIARATVIKEKTVTVTVKLDYLILK